MSSQNLDKVLLLLRCNGHRSKTCGCSRGSRLAPHREEDGRPHRCFRFTVAMLCYGVILTLFRLQLIVPTVPMGSPSPSNSTPPSSLSNSSDAELNCCETTLNRCGACAGPLVLPKVLTCFHAFCRPCLERIEESRRIVCPSCRVETYLTSEGVAGLLPYFGPSGIDIGLKFIVFFRLSLFMYNFQAIDKYK